MTAALTCLSSMATRQVLAELLAAFEQRSGQPVVLTAIGGVDAAKRVQAGEHFDLVVLAADAIDKLVAAGALQA
ncbi:MAG: substrate-binding domain-containing protein, partial [Rubrivivax sp.]